METYTPTEADQLGAALLFTGQLSAALGSVLDVTDDQSQFDLFDYVNLLPAEPAAEILSVTALALAEAKARIEAIGVAVESAIEGNAALTEAERAEIDEAFEALMWKLYPEAKDDGLT